MEVFIVGDTGLLDGLALWPMATPGDVLLYVEKDGIPPRVFDELTRLDPDGIVIVGGTLRVSVQVEADLAQFAPTTRVAGPTRFDTPIEIAQTLYPVPIDPPPVDQPPTGLFIPAYGGNPDVGLTDPSALTPYTGPSTIPSGVYVDKEFSGQHTLYDSSTFDNCWFHGGPTHAVQLRNGARQYFTDCEFGKEGQDCDRLISDYGGTYTAIRCNLHDAEDGFKLSDGATIRMCHVHDLASSDTGGHFDGIQAESGGSNYLIEYSNISGLKRGGVNGNGALFVKADLGGEDIDGVVADNNYFNGGNYTVKFRNGTSNKTVNTVFTNNIFGPDFRYGLWGADGGTIDIWSGNVDHNGVPVTL